MRGYSLDAREEALRISRIKNLLRKGATDEFDLAPPLYVQLNLLVGSVTGKKNWKEISRWMKYEENLEGSDRWSKPHVQTPYLNAIMNIQNALMNQNCIVCLDLDSEKINGLKSVFVSVLSTNTTINQLEANEIANLIFESTSLIDKNKRRSKKLAKKMSKETESAVLLTGRVDRLTNNLMIFCRLKRAVLMDNLNSLKTPVKFLFLVFSASDSLGGGEAIKLSKAMGVLLSDKLFLSIAYKATSVGQLMDGIDEFLYRLTVLPSTIWDTGINLKPLKNLEQKNQISNILRIRETSSTDQEKDDLTLNRTKRLFGGLIADIKRKSQFALSDFTDALHVQCLASVIFLFFACITPIVTFGGVMGQETEGYMGTMETLLSGVLCGVVYALFSGQPMIIVGATGPLLVFESIVYHICKTYGENFLAVRFWIGIWVSSFLLAIVALDLSFVVKYITRFTEESFSVLISVIFIYESFAKVLKINRDYRVETMTVGARMVASVCFCLPQFNGTNVIRHNVSNRLNITGYPEQCITSTDKILVHRNCIGAKECQSSGWTMEGADCRYAATVPDVFLFSVLLFFGTFILAYSLRSFRKSRFFPSWVRNLIGDYAVFVAVSTFVGFDILMGLDTPKLNIPSKFITTNSDRGWLANPLALKYWWISLLCSFPALLATILVFLDQQITAVIINRKENKLKKGHGYHLDLLVLSVLIVVCSFFGLPWFVAATVRSITHLQSLQTHSETMPGEPTRINGVREQRVTGIAVHAMIGLSIMLTSVLKIIPMPVLYGVFLYMGLTSLTNIQFVQRILLVFMPVKYQPEYAYLNHVKVNKVHLYTLVQTVCFACMWTIKTVKTTSIGFPMMLLVLIATRKLLAFVFTTQDLSWLDHLLPGEVDLNALSSEDDDLSMTRF